MCKKKGGNVNRLAAVGPSFVISDFKILQPDDLQGYSAHYGAKIRYLPGLIIVP